MTPHRHDYDQDLPGVILSHSASYYLWSFSSAQDGGQLRHRHHPEQWIITISIIRMRITRNGLAVLWICEQHLT